jgi:hypothetical protein
MSDFKPGDRVRHAGGSEAVVTFLRLSHRRNVYAADVVWYPSGGWADNVPLEDLTLVARAVYFDQERIDALAYLIEKSDDPDYDLNEHWDDLRAMIAEAKGTP